MPHFDILVVGSGLAGLTVALHVADHQKVGLITKRRLMDAASSWAQGGIAAVTLDEDSTGDHVRDTLAAGAGLCDAEVTHFVASEAPAAIDWLVRLGVPFTRDGAHGSTLHLALEGGHRFRRVIHVADSTGHAVQQTLVGKVLAHPNIAVLEHQVAVDLITGAGIGADDNRCHGIHCFDSRNRRIETYTAGHVVLATGGAGQVYLHTSNPDIATGDGIAMGWRAGCAVQNMEFVQFHPTCLHHRDARSFLVSEALRGEGGILRLPGGERFMHRHDERGELAPRDVVARAIDFEMKQHGLDCVHLDITHRPEGFLHEHFPSIHARCLQLGIDMARQPIPVVPAAHYLCGGLRTDIAGRTGLANLYAVGETACTGLHGANRLASNSLLECLALGRAAARDILESDPTPRRGVPQPDRSRCAGAADQAAIVRSRDQLQRLMWDCVGIVRTSRLLDGAAQRIALMRQELKDCCAGFPLETALIELRNLVQTAELIVRCAQARPESRGLHCNLDYPGLAPLARDTVLHSVLS